MSRRYKNQNRVQGGKTAVRRGKVAEQELDLISQTYHNRELISWHETHAKFVPQGQVFVQGRGKRTFGYWEKQGEADRIAVLPPSGRTCWIEAKSAQSKTKNKNRVLISEGLHQFEKMRDAVRVGGLAYYALRWRQFDPEDFRAVEWRFYPVANLTKSGKSIVFIRQDGIFIPLDESGLPDWLPVIKAKNPTS